MKKYLSLVFVLIPILSYSQSSSSEIYQDIKKLSSLKKVLYVAAHPDDENTRALAYFSLGENAETAYFSLTRGDGGQNLIGNELSEDLGVLRTQELLAARFYDKSYQYFSRAVDFGYSKTAEETFKKWGKEEVLSDVVLMIRKFKPNIIITRFPPDKRAGHGHHTASTILAMEAFDKAADPNFLPEQVKEFGIWQTESIYWNTSNWWGEDLAKNAKNNPEIIKLDIGGFNPLLSQSYNEIGTIARSQHKCQGFGDIIERGSRIEYFQYLKGVKLKNTFFENSNYSWKDLENDSLDLLFNQLLENYNFSQPENSIDLLIDIHKQLKTLPNDDFKAKKLKLSNQIILESLGIYAEIIASNYALAVHHNTEVKFNIINRTEVPVILKKAGGKTFNNTILPFNELFSETLKINGKKEISNPYWLYKPFNTLYTVPNKSDLLEPESQPTFNLPLELEIKNEIIEFELPIFYKWRDPAFGERKREFISTPSFAVNAEENQLILQPNKEKKIRIKIRSFTKNINDQIIIKSPKGWEISPSIIPIKLAHENQEIFKEITVKPTSDSQRGHLSFTDNNGEICRSFSEIKYDHIPTQVIFKPEQIECIVLDAKIKPGKIAYIKGAEDLVPEAISQLGFELTTLNVSEIPAFDLSQFNSIVLGIRVYNVHSELINFNNILFKYVQNGGNLIMQYNTSSRFSNGEHYGPYPFEISRNRVSEEDAKAIILEPKHQIFNYPNKISVADFDHWVQERGLYFAENWDSQYAPLIAWNDENEPIQNGGLIVAKYGKGQFVYTGISFFRQLPNGVEGAFKIFANILSY